MAEWVQTTLGQVLPLSYGRALPEPRRCPGDVPVVSSSGTTGWHSAALVEDPTVVVGRKGNVGSVYYLDGPSYPIDTAFYTEGTRAIDLRFAYYFLTWLDLRRLSQDSAVPGLNRDEYSKLAVSIPPREEQERIARMLGALDDKIAANTRLAALADELVRTSARRELGASTDEVRLGELVMVTKGVSYRSADLVPSDVALVTLKCFARDGSYAPRGLKAYAGVFRPEQILRAGELAVAQTDLTQAAEVVGRVVSVPPADRFATLVASLDVAIVRPKAGVPRGFLLALLGQDDFRTHCREHTSGTTVLHLARGAIESYRAPSLPREPMERLAARVELLASVAPRTQSESRTLAGTRDALLPGLMSGTLRVRDAEHLAETLT